MVHLGQSASRIVVAAADCTMAESAPGAAGDEQRVLVELLLAMTAVTGAVDAVSILRLGHVFVANMTGNVVFLGFALAGSSGFSVSASLVALAAFLFGAAVGGRALRAETKRETLRLTAGVEGGLVALAAIVGLVASGTSTRYTMTVLLALAMGARNAVVRRLAVPDLTTTVLTMTLTGLAVDAPEVALGTPTFRRIGAVAAMLVGAVGGALLVLHASTVWALGVVTLVLAVITVLAGVPGQIHGTGS
jgi:uncharacterized membrane protein YoaK (UPF0700 family)